MSGFFLIGGVFATHAINTDNIILFILAFFLSIMLILSIYAYNAFGGFGYDVLNDRLDHMALNKKQYLFSSIIFIIFAAFFGFFLNLNTGIFALLIYFIWMLYSFPEWGFKHKPFIGTLLHFTAEILHFLMIYSLFVSIDQKAVLISIYFSLIFAAGHLFHEIIDYEPDKESGLKTGAIFMGFRLSQDIVILIFTIAAIYWSFLFYIKIVSFIEFLCFILAFVLQLMVWLFFRKKINNIKERTRYRLIYRIFYGIGGLIILLSRI